MKCIAAVVGLVVSLPLLTGPHLTTQQEKDEEQAKIRKFLEVSGLRHTYEKALREMPLAFVEDFGPDAIPTLKELVTEKDVEILLGRVERRVERRFTSEEFDELIAFYESPIGKKLAKMLPLVLSVDDGTMVAWENDLRARALATLRERGIARGHATREEVSAIGALRTISSVQAQFREGDRDHDKFLDYAQNLSQLLDARLVGDELGGGVYKGYVFTLSGSTFDWYCKAEPEDTRRGLRNFIICTDGVIRFAEDGDLATCSSPAVR